MNARFSCACAIAATACAAAAWIACDTRYDETCSVASNTRVVDVTDLEPAGSAVGAISLLDNGDGTALASWMRLRAQGDAGAEDAATDAATNANEAGISGDSALGGVTLPSYASSVIVSGEKYASVRHVPAPKALAARVASTDAVDAEWISAGAVWSWVETAGHTDPDGTPRSSAKFSIELVSDSGAEGPLLVPDVTSCEDCALSVSIAPLGNTVVILVTVAAGSTAKPPLPPPATYLMNVATDGSNVVTRAVPGLTPSPTPVEDGGVASLGFADLSSPASLAADEGHLFLLSTRGTWLVDASLAVQAGPLPALAGNADLEWDLTRSDAMLVSAGSSNSPITGQTAINLQRFSNDGTETMAPARVSDGQFAYGVAFDGAIYGVLFAGSAHTYLARTKQDGTKIGADFSVDHAGTPNAPHVFHAPARDAFSDIYVNTTRIYTRSILCAD